MYILMLFFRFRNLMTFFNCVLGILLVFVNVVYLMPFDKTLKNETHTFRWATGPDLNSSLCATVTAPLHHENTSAHSTSTHSDSGE